MYGNVRSCCESSVTRVLIVGQIVFNLLLFVRNTLEEADPGSREGTEGAGSEGAAALSVLQTLLKRQHVLAKLLATLRHQLQNVPAMTLSGETLTTST